MVLVCLYSAAFSLLADRKPHFGELFLLLFTVWGLLLLFADKLIGFIFRLETVSEEDAPQLYTIVRELARNAEIRMPAVFIIPSASGHIFSARSLFFGSIAVSHGTFRILNEEEMSGVLAQAVARIKKKEALCAALAAVTGGFILRPFLKCLSQRKAIRGKTKFNLGRKAFFPLLAAAYMLVRISISQSDIFEADKEGAFLCGDPLYLASGLDKLESLTREFPLRNANPALDALFLFSEPCLSRIRSFLPAVHPGLEERISRLDRMAREKSLLQTWS